MLPRSSQGSPPRGPLCMPLLRLSYATASNDSICPIPWVHLSSQHELFAILDTVRTQNPSGQVLETRVFKILRDPEIVMQENIDLDKLASGAQHALAEAQDPNTRDRTPKIAIIVKAPVIAIRYPLDGGQIRRFQIRFESEEDYYETMKMFSRAKIPMTEAGTVSSRRPKNAQPTHSANLYAGDSTVSIGSRPTTAPSSTPAQLQAAPTNSSIALGLPPAGAIDHSAKYDSAVTPAKFRHGFRHEFQHEIYSQHKTSGSNRDSQIQANMAPPVPAPWTEINKDNAIGTSNPTPGLIYDSASISATQPAHYLSPIKPAETEIGDNKLRPTTAPALHSEDLSLLLPPKRDLPFLKLSQCTSPRAPSPNKDTDRNVRVANRSEIAGIPTPMSKTLPQTTSATERAQDSQEPDSVPSEVAKTTNKRKRGPAKKAATTPAVKKPRTATTRKKAAASKSQESKVLSVEELLQQSQEKAKQATEMLKQSAPVTDLQSDTIAKAASCTDRASQVDLPITAKKPSNKQIDTMATSSTFLASDPPRIPSPNTLRSPLALLLQNSNFMPTSCKIGRAVDAADSSGTWEALSEDLKREALETYFCNNIKDPGFLHLIEMIDGLVTSRMVL